MPIRHKKVSGLADNGVSSQVQPSNWNDDHELEPGSVLEAMDALAATPNSIPRIDGLGSGAMALISAFVLTTLNAADATAFRALIGSVGTESPAFTGIPTAPTAANGDNTTQISTTAFVQSAITALIDSSPAALDTLNELAAALGDDPNFATTVTNTLALKATIESPVFTGNPTAPTIAGTADSTTSLATTAFVQAVRALLAPLDSPAFTGNPTAPTPAAADNDTSIATTAMVQAAIAAAFASGGDPHMRNALDNGGFEVWQRGISVPATHTAGNRVVNADRWWVRPAGASVTSSRSALVPTGAVTRYSKYIAGAASVTTVDFGQRILADRMPAIKRTITVQAWVLNNTGAAFAPSLLIGTPAASNDFTTVTNRLTQVLQSCANGVWTQVSHTVDISGYTNISNGMEFVLQVPSGSMTAGKSVQFSEVQIAPRSSVTNFLAEKREETLRSCYRHYCKTFDEDITPASSVGETANGVSAITAGTAAGAGVATWAYPGGMMAGQPTITTYNPQAAGSGWRNIIDNTDVAAATNAGRRAVRVTVNGACADGKQHLIHLVAEYEP